MSAITRCTAGKDRTGVVSAVLLSLAGVSDEDIVDDYVISRELNKDRLQAFLEEHPEVDINTVMPNESNIKAVLKVI